MFPQGAGSYNPRPMRAHDHLTALSDQELLLHAGEGCSDCFALLFHRYFRHVFSVCIRILRDRQETEDMLQEVFLAIYTQRESYDPARGSVRTWILQFAYFKALLRRRYLRIRNYYSQQETAEAREIRQTSPPRLMEMSPAERARYVETGIDALNPKQRQVIELVHFEGHTLQESSRIVRESLANTRNLYYRGLKALRTRLHEEAVRKETRKALVLDANDARQLEA